MDQSSNTRDLERMAAEDRPRQIQSIKDALGITEALEAIRELKKAHPIIKVDQGPLPEIQRTAAQDRGVLTCEDVGCPCASKLEVAEGIRPTHRATITVDFISDEGSANDMAQSMANRLEIEFGNVNAKVHAEVRKL